MLRRSLLFLSEREGLKNTLLKTRRARALAARFVAGEGLDKALDVVRTLNDSGFRVTLDYLGESVSRPEEAAAATAAYVESLTRIDQSDASSTISLKLTQLGLDIDLDLCSSNLERIVAVAEASNSFVRIDMESSNHTAPILEVFRRVSSTSSAVGIVIQSYLLRSESDVSDLIAQQKSVRLCKGAYSEPAAVAYQRREDVDANYVHLTRRLLSEAKAAEVVGGVPPVAIATHDDAMIEQARSFADAHAVTAEAFEFQMLYGVRRDVQAQLVRSGYNVRVYVPYGTEWYAYFMRRMAERPANLLFVARAAVGE